MPPIFRCSQLDRLMACPGSGWLPQVDKGYGQAALWGNFVHSWMETGVVEEGENKRHLEKRIRLSGVKREELWPNLTHEVPFAYNLVTDEVRRYPTTPPPPGFTLRSHKDAWKAAFSNEWMVGTVDGVGELLDSWWTDDLKTGRAVHWNDYRWQQSSYAIMVSKWKYDALLSGRSTITHWPRYPVAGKPFRSGAVLDEAYLKKSLQSLKDLRARILAADPASLREGDQCYFCPSKGGCPELVKLGKRETSNE